MNIIKLEDMVQDLEGIPKLLNSLMYGSYKSNREEGLSHEALVKIGVGNEGMRDLYNCEKRLN